MIRVSLGRYGVFLECVCYGVIVILCDLDGVLFYLIVNYD